MAMGYLVVSSMLKCDRRMAGTNFTSDSGEKQYRRLFSVDDIVPVKTDVTAIFHIHLLSA